MAFSKCLPLSLGMKRNAEDEERERQKKLNRRIEKDLYEDRKREMNCLKLLLLGTGESGKSTLIKQMRIIHIDGFSLQEKVEYINNIRMNIRDSIVSILSAMDHLNIPFQDPQNKVKCNYLFNEAFSPKFDYPPQFFDYVEDLWRDDGVQMCFQRSNVYQLMDSAKYFLDRVPELRDPAYIPTNQDILRCRKLTDAVSEIRFTVKEKNGTPVPFKAFDVGGQKGERKKWFQLFDSVTAILFLVDCSSYDLTLREDRNKSRLMDAMEVFYQAWSNKYLQGVPMLVFINKIDILEEKVQAGRYIGLFLQEILDSSNLQPEMGSVSGSSVSGASSRVDMQRGSLEQQKPPLNVNAPSSSSSSSVQRLQPSSSGGTGSLRPHIATARRRLSSALNLDNVMHQISASWSDSLASSGLRPSRKPSTAVPPSNTDPATASTPTAASSSSAQTPQLMPAKYVARNLYTGSSLSSAHIYTKCVEILKRFPYDTFKPSLEEQREFTAALPASEPQGSRTPRLGKGPRGGLVSVDSETVRTACYIRRLFMEITKERLHQDRRERRSLFYYTCAINTDSIQKVLDGCRAFLMEEHMEKFGIS